MAQLKTGSTVNGETILVASDIIDNLTSTSTTDALSAKQGKALKTLIDDIWKTIYPVGAIYISVSSTSPATLFGGTWSAFATGRTLVGIDTSDTDFDTVEETRGAKTHTLETTEIPSHAHTVTNKYGNVNTGSSWAAMSNMDNAAAPSSSTISSGVTGGGLAHNNIQPSIVVYMWKRTA